MKVRYIKMLERDDRAFAFRSTTGICVRYVTEMQDINLRSSCQTTHFRLQL